jgi:NitT/TauT family transport system substrate-binding protein
LPISFRSLALAAAAAAVFATAPVRAQTLETLHVAGIPVELAGSLYYGVDLGLFQKAGLDVQIITLSSTAATTPAVASGAVDIGTTNLVSIALAHENNVPIVVVAAAGASNTKSALEGIIVPKDSPIKTAADLNGKTIITSVLKNNLQIETNAWMGKHGGDYTTLKWIEAPNPATEAMVATGKVDAATLGEPFLSAAIATGDVRLLTGLGAEIAPVVVLGGYISNTDYAKAHLDTLRKFAAVLFEAGKWANAHPADAAAILAKYAKTTGTPLATAHHAVFLETPFKASDIQPIINAAARYGVLKAPFPAADLVLPYER